MALTDSDFKILNQIHSNVMRRFRYRTDQQKWQQLEFWEGDETLLEQVRSHGHRIEGDCEEAARAFMYLAREAGYPARLIVGLDENGNGHCWCEVADTEYATAVYLDNRKRRVVDRSQMMDMEPIAASPWNPVSGDTRPWVKLK